MRRSFLFGGAAALATFMIARTADAVPVRRIALRHAGTGARFEGPWHDGRRPDPGAMAELSAALADEGANPPRPFDADTIDIVWQVAMRTRLGGALDIHSGYRTPQVNRRVHGAGDSQHLRASAIDFGVPVGRIPAVAEAALKLGRGGVGVYRARGFVHLDSGPVRNWGDAGLGGRAPSARDQTLNRIAEEWRRGTVRIDRF